MGMNLMDSYRDIKKAFSFLKDEFFYELSDDEETSMWVSFLFVNREADRKVNITYDFKENHFYFNLIKGVKTPFPNDSDLKNIKPFFNLIGLKNDNISRDKLQPTAGSYKGALAVNVQLLKNNSEILKGERWFNN